MDSVIKDRGYIEFRRRFLIKEGMKFSYKQ